MKTSVHLRLALFLFLLIALTLIAHFTVANSAFSMFLIMWTPGIAALVVSVFTRRKFSEFGWRWSSRYALLGWLTPVLYGFIAYGLIWFFGIGDVPKPLFLERAQMTMDFTSESNFLIIMASFFYISLLNLLPNMFLALGEELGWRGFLVPELFKISSFKFTAIASGLVWMLWHFPGIISGNYGDNSLPLWYQLMCFGILVISGAVILAWLRLASGSFWPAVIFHAVHNGVIQNFFNNLTIDTGNTKYFMGEFGIMVPLVSLIFSLFCLYNFQSRHYSGFGLEDSRLEMENKSSLFQRF